MSKKSTKTLSEQTLRFTIHSYHNGKLNYRGSWSSRSLWMVACKGASRTLNCWSIKVAVCNFLLVLFILNSMILGQGVLLAVVWKVISILQLFLALYSGSFRLQNMCTVMAVVDKSQLISDQGVPIGCQKKLDACSRSTRSKHNGRDSSW